MASETDEEVLIRDLDLDMIRKVRNDWQFYRDRRPDSYTSITKP
jgi:N-carbamoylputrescine amidase